MKIEFDGGFLLFGDKNLMLGNFPEYFPDLVPVYLDQVHGSQIQEITESNEGCVGEGDALWSRIPKKVLVIRTADCVPIIFHSPLGVVGAVHAGWRGVAQNIAGEFVNHLQSKGVPPESLRCWIGPHIQLSSFQVQDSVLRLLVKSGQRQFYRQDEKGIYVDLQKIVQSQLVAAGLKLKKINDSSVDTVTSDLYHSYRKNKRLGKPLNSGERNLSLVVLDEKL